MKCPVCTCGETVESRTEGIGEDLLAYSPVSRFRCLNCGHRFWAFRNSLLKVVYLVALAALAVTAGLQILRPSTGPAPSAGKAQEPAASLRQVAVPDGGPSGREQARHERADTAADPAGGDDEGLPGAEAHAQGPGVEAEDRLALRERPDPAAPATTFLDRGEPYSVIYLQGNWAVIQLPDGTLGWAGQEEIAAWSEDTATAGAMAVQEQPAPAEPPVPPADGVSETERIGPETSLAPSGMEQAAAAPPGSIRDAVVVRVDIGRVREAPLASAPIVFRVFENEALQVLDETGDWLRIRHSSGWSGWAHKGLFTAGERALPASAPKEPGRRIGAPVTAADLPEGGEAHTPAAGPEKGEAPTAGAQGASGRITAESNPPAGRELTVKVLRGRVRSGPSLSAPVISLVEKDQRVRAVNESGRWLQLESGGWAHRSLFAAAEPAPPPAEGKAPAKTAAPERLAKKPGPPAHSELTVKVLRGRVRSAPSLSAPVLFLVEKGQRFQALEKRGKWFRLPVGSGPGGWAHESLFLVSAGKDAGSPPGGAGPQAGMTATKRAAPPPVEGNRRVVRVEVGLARSAPDPDAPVRFRLYGSEVVTILEERGEWVRVRRMNGWTGWAHRSLFLE